jgi:cysteinyl-tRNA synthetase
MTLTLYNSLSRRQETFTPLDAPRVGIYCCGVTVYDYCHLGHARSYIVWDILRRYLEWRGYQVRYVQNFTDIDDKILNRAKEEGTSMDDVARRFTDAYFEDMERLNVRPADFYPRATHTLNGIQRLIEELEAKGYAYKSGGDVYYEVRRFPEYGQLSGRNLEDLQAGASGRVAEGEQEAPKRDPFDFALWKRAKPEEPAWESPWGQGRPGWHIECSAMVRENLGETADIHCGGADLMFPHHENEIAQSVAANGKPLAKYWLHNGMVTVNGEKMSKSLGNFTTIRDLLGQGIDPMAVRLFVMQAHYRKPLDFNDEAIASATNGWKRLQEALLFGSQYGEKLDWQQTSATDSQNLDKDAVERFNQAMDDDLNTPSALAVVFELVKIIRRDRNLLTHEGKTETPSDRLQQIWYTLVNLAQVLGLEASAPAETQPQGDTLSDEEVENLIQQRTAARKAKNFAEADRLRDQLQAAGITLIDKPGGITQWHRNS